jgi:uncharacterized membrane protein YphA (DoxX/SURF4 family)
MKKSDKIIYWVFTLWLSLGLTSTGIVQVLKTEDEVTRMTHLGFPVYALMLLGVLKILAVVAILIPRFPLVKEWAYAGIFFNMIGALYSHIVLSDNMFQMLPALLMLTLTAISWYFRPADRKVALASN